MDDMFDKLLDALADKLTERLQAPHKDLYSANDLAERYGVTSTTIRRKMAAGEFGELISVGERTRLVPWAGVQAYEAEHLGTGSCKERRAYRSRRSAPRGNPGPI